MRNGTFALVQAFTSITKRRQDLALASGQSGREWQSVLCAFGSRKALAVETSTDRRAVLMLTDGVDRYYGTRLCTILTSTRRSTTL